MGKGGTPERRPRCLYTLTKVGKMIFVARLPPETSRLIMSQLSSSERSACFNVSTVWRAFMKSWPGTWRTLVMNDTGHWYLPFHRAISSRMLFQWPIQADAVRTLIYRRDESDDEMSPDFQRTLVQICDLNLTRLNEIHCDLSNRAQRVAADPKRTSVYLMHDIILKSANYLRCLCLYGVRLSTSGAWWSNLINNCPHLTDLSYTFNNMTVQGMEGEFILRRPTQLTCLRWHANVDMPFSNLLPFCPHLRRLHMDPPTTDIATRELFTNIKHWCPSIADLFLTEFVAVDRQHINPKAPLRLRFSVALDQAEVITEFIVSHASEFSEIAITPPEHPAVREVFFESFQLENPSALLFPHVQKLEYTGTLSLGQCQFPSLQDLYISEWDGQTLQEAQRFSGLTTLVLLMSNRFRRGLLLENANLVLPANQRLSWPHLWKLVFEAAPAHVISDLLEHMDIHPLLKHVSWEVQGEISTEVIDWLGRVAPNLEYLRFIQRNVVLTSEILCKFTQWPFLKRVVVDEIGSVSGYDTWWLQNRGINVVAAMTGSVHLHSVDESDRNAMLQCEVTRCFEDEVDKGAVRW
ncbi:hypothetical protein BCR43DRAFT_491066 [Syncephalastrum racemosum]|uniref:F-box domain-containing protein n=1 Tax=Syncephalastrum racemosum TaxID=13706 RepID=A0A1X2HH40_SYNRA|nr:hypothetical protein BCR43DRAFT_491066 [Syncephalastrum racemosum]